ncbi:MAG: ribosome silencing factor [Schleiferiaceae bacterium]|jgi:ribosome-associated protein|nr:ribosome silencing factor [Schleiferiaceae bacterium]
MSQTQIDKITPLVSTIIEGITDVKGVDIKVLDLRSLDNSVCDFFVICEGTSNTHVSAIQNSIEKSVRENLNDKPWHVEGADQASWILMDYVNTVVHVFQHDVREFYDIEGMWGDAEITTIEN